MYLAMLGFEQMLKASDESPSRQAWFEGFAHGLHEAEYLTSKELEEAIQLCHEVCGGKVEFLP